MATNVPGPVAAARLHHLGAEIIKIEPPAGDPLGHVCPGWYQTLAQGQRILSLNLKVAAERAQLDPLLAHSDLLLTATRPAVLQRLSLDWPTLHARHPQLCQVAILGYAPPQENRAGHDLAYQAATGLLSPLELPRTLLADLAAAERVVSLALTLPLDRERSQEGSYAHVALAEIAAEFAAPLRYGLTAPGGMLGGRFAGYQLYRTAQGWIAVAALESHFWQRLRMELDLGDQGVEEMEQVFLTRTAPEWERWANERDLPLVAVVHPAPHEGSSAA